MKADFKITYKMRIVLAVFLTFLILGCWQADTLLVGGNSHELVANDGVLIQSKQTVITIDCSSDAAICFFSIDRNDNMFSVVKEANDKRKTIKRQIVDSGVIILNYSLSSMKIPFLICAGDSINIEFSSQLIPYISYSKFGKEEMYNVFYAMNKKRSTIFSTSNSFLLNPKLVNVDSLYKNDSVELASVYIKDSIDNDYVKKCKAYLKSQYLLQKRQMGIEIIDSSFLFDDENLNYPNFRELISYNHYSSSSKNSKVEMAIMQDYYASALLEKGEIRNYLLFYAMGWMRNKNKKLFEKYKSSFIKDCTNRNYINEIISDISTAEKPGGVGEFFGYLDSSRLSLNDIVEKCKGKVIYLDLWASWCAPCRAAMDGSKTLHEKYKGRDMCFVYASIDDKVPAWKKAVKEEGLERMDNNFLVVNQKESLFVKKFKVNTIPRYIIFDKSGKLVDNNAPSPDSEEINILLDKLLKEK